MPFRKIPIVIGEIYHIFNRSVARQPIFLTIKDFNRAIECIKFYQHGNLPMRFSHYNRLPKEQKNRMSKQIQSYPQIVEILSFCLIPNHVHFLLKGLTEKGAIQFMSNFQNSYAKYFNTKNKRSGALFQSMFKAVRIETDEQLLHVGRYVHLNPLTSYVVREKKDLEGYPWSSYLEYIGKSTSPISNTKPILNFYSSIEEFKKFTLDQINYQRELNRVKHLTLE